MKSFLVLAAFVFAPPVFSGAVMAEDAAPAAAPAGVATPDPQLAVAGKGLYARHCSHCHGPNMVNPGTISYDLRRFPPNAKERFVESVIFGRNGRMPPWGDKVNLEDIDAIWAYVLTGGKP